MQFFSDRGPTWGAVSDLSLISDLSQKFIQDWWRVKSELKLSQKLSQKQNLTPDLSQVCLGGLVAQILNELSNDFGLFSPLALLQVWFFSDRGPTW